MRSELKNIGEGRHLLSLFYTELSLNEVQDLVQDVFSGDLLLDGEVKKHEEDIEILQILDHKIRAGSVEFVISTEKSSGRN